MYYQKLNTMFAFFQCCLGRKFTFILLRLLPLLCLAAGVQAQFTYGTSDGEITITGYSGVGGAVTIPATIDGLPVTRIGNSAFQGSSSFTRVEIPNSVIAIGESAFFGCSILTTVAIGSGVTNIGTDAFLRCTSLVSVTIPNSVITVGKNAFNGCTSLTAITVDSLNSFLSSVDGVLFNGSQTELIQYPGGKTGGDYTIPNSVTKIGGGAFYDAFRLTSVTILNRVTAIGDDAFYGCFGLTELTIPNGVTSIGGTAFIGCNGLTRVTIPNSVTGIGVGAFTDCTGLAAITVDDLNSSFSSVDGILFNRGQDVLIQCPAGKVGNYAIPGTVNQIGRLAFNGCRSLTSVTIPNSVDSIGMYAFIYCFSLTQITLPNRLIAIEANTFLFCTNLTRVAIPDSVRSIGEGAFNYCIGLTHVTLPNGLTNIANWTFENCSSLRGIGIPQSVTHIGNQAFQDCTALLNVFFEGNAVATASDAFSNDARATLYYLPGATGWGSTLAGRPVQRWRVGVWVDQFRFTIDWPGKSLVVVEARLNIDDSVWLPVGTNTLADGSTYFTDPQWSYYPGRFYRLRAR